MIRNAVPDLWVLTRRTNIIMTNYDRQSYVFVHAALMCQLDYGTIMERSWWIHAVHVVPPCRLPSVRPAKHFSVTLGDGLSHLQNEGDAAGVDSGTASAASAASAMAN